MTNRRRILTGLVGFLLIVVTLVLLRSRSDYGDDPATDEISAPTPDGRSGAGRNAARHLDAPYVILVSFDGLRWDYLDRIPTPNFDRVAATGTRADRLIPVFPTKTFPTHYSIATGMYAETHGLVGNAFWAPDKGARYSLGNRSVVEDGSWYRGEPIWVTAERQGMVSASFFFVGSEAAVGGVRPSYWHRYDASIPNDDRVHAVLDWLRLPPVRRPHLVTLYFSDVDDAGHAFGPDSEEVRESVIKVDRNLGRLLDGIADIPHGDEVHVVLVSDHGMLIAPAADADVLDVSLFPGVRLAEGGPYASIFVDEGGRDRAVRVRDSIAAIMPENDVFLREDVPERFHYSSDPRIGDIVVIAAPGRQVVSPDRIPRRDTYTHGWDNRIPEMSGILIASGPRIGVGVRTGPVEAVHVYPLLAEILGLDPNPEADGNLKEIRSFIAADSN